jgi:hypothetical protein
MALNGKQKGVLRGMAGAAALVAIAQALRILGP